MSERRQMSGLGGGIAVFLLLVTFKLNVLPSLLAKEGIGAVVWATACATAVDIVIGVLCYAVARKGGISCLPMPEWGKRTVGALCALFCLAKVALYTYEVGSFASTFLYDTANFWVLSVGFVVASAVLAIKGAKGIARTSIVFCFLAGVLAVLTAFFVGQEGDGYHLFSLLRGDGLGMGLLKHGLWMGDGIVLLFADMRTVPVKGRRWLPIGWALGAVASIGFALVFVYTFGSAAPYIDHAFARTLMKESPHELGAVDWPIILMWLNAVPAVAAYHLTTAAEGLQALVSKGSHGLWVGIATALSIGLFAGVFVNKNGIEYASDPWCSLVAVVLVSVAVVMATSGVLHEKSSQIKRQT